MTWNGNGTFNPPSGPEFPAIVGDLIRAEHYNAVVQAICDGFGNTIPRNGEAPITGNINANSLYTIINLPAANSNGQPVRYQEFTALQTAVNSLANNIEPFVYLNAGIV